MEQPSVSPPPAGSSIFDLLFSKPATIGVISAVLLIAIAALPNLGVIIGWAFVVAAMLICIRSGSLGELGFRRPVSWPRTIAWGVAIGIATQVLFSIVIDPLLERMTGKAIDISMLDGMRGNAGAFLIMLAVGWVVGGFLEEMLFRGYLLRRLTRVLGNGPLAAATAVALPAISFGMAHSYQDVPGMLSTGLIALLLGVLFVWTRYNLWLPIIVHGVIDTVGLTFIYLDVDRALNHLLF
jgi:membrane protease YdiL (CAAX protease family)